MNCSYVVSLPVVIDLIERDWSISTADGSALVKVGNTTVICGIKAVNNRKYSSSKLNFNEAALHKQLFNNGKKMPVSLYAGAGKPYSGGTRKRLHCTQCGPSASVFLSVSAGPTRRTSPSRQPIYCRCNRKLCWVLYCDIMCLDYNGNLLDACIIALLAALKNTRLPEVTINTETHGPEVNLEKRHRLQIHKHPVGASFCVFDDSILITDPTAEEECLSTAQLTVVTNEEGRLCSIHKPGGTSLSAEKLQEFISRATARQKEIQKLIDKVIHSVKPAQ
ncbi:hypothetical protein PAMP_007148 [Pampus punctatissimus]